MSEPTLTAFVMLVFAFGFGVGCWYIAWKRAQPISLEWKIQHARSAVKYYREERDKYQKLLDGAKKDLQALEPYTAKQPASES